MPYLPTLLGITIWVITVAVSSNALVSYENNKQQQAIQAKIDGISQQTIDTVSSTTPTPQEVISPPQIPPEIQKNTNTKTITPEVVAPPQQVVITPTKKPNTTMPTTIRIEREEENEGDN